jgi:cell division protein FtsL
MKESSFNNILSFLITSILIFMLAFIMMTNYIEMYKKTEKDIEKIQEIQEEKENTIKDLEEKIKEIERSEKDGD